MGTESIGALRARIVDAGSHSPQKAGLQGSSTDKGSPTSSKPAVGTKAALNAGNLHAGSAKFQEAAQEFEALLLSHVLRTAREAGSSGWLGSESATSNPTMELAETQLARAMAERGVLGLTQMLADGIAKNSADAEQANEVSATAEGDSEL